MKQTGYGITSTGCINDMTMRDFKKIKREKSKRYFDHFERKFSNKNWLGLNYLIKPL